MSYEFDAIDDLIELPIATSIPDSDFAIGGWMYPRSEGEGAEGRMFNTHTGGGTGLQLCGFGAGVNSLRAQITYSTAVAQSITPDNVLALNAWNFVVMGHRSSDNRIQLFRGDERDRVAEQSYTTQTAGTGTFSTGASRLFVGNNEPATRTFDGRIRRMFYVAGRIPSLVELDRIRRTGVPPLDASIGGWWPLIRDANDYSGLGQHATVITGALQAFDDPLPGVRTPRRRGLRVAA